MELFSARPGSVGEEKFSLILLVSLAGSEKQTDKDRLTGKKRIHLFHVSCMRHRSLHKKTKTQRDS